MESEVFTGDKCQSHGEVYWYWVQQHTVPDYAHSSSCLLSNYIILTDYRTIQSCILVLPQFGSE